MDTQQLIGKLLDESAQRDAIHIAVAPMLSDFRLEPGEHVAIVDGKAFPSTRQSVNGAVPADSCIGIVDPFLKDVVNPGERFFLFLYPNTAKSLRHVYEHPGLPEESAEPTKKAAIAWLTEYAAHHREFGTFGTLVRYLTEYLNEGYGSDWAEGTEATRELWTFFEIATGRLVPESVKAEGYFSCSC